MFNCSGEQLFGEGEGGVEAVTAQAATDFADRQQDLLANLAQMFKGTKDLNASIARLQEENSRLKSENERLVAEASASVANSIADRLKASPTLVQRTNHDVNTLKDALMALRAEHPDMAMVLGSVKDDKPALLVVLGDSRVASGLNAGQMVRTLGKEIQGGGGGQPGFATAGGKDAAGMEKALQAAKEMLG